MRHLSASRKTLFRTLFSMLALTLLVSCSSGGGTQPTLLLDETPLDGNRSQFVVMSDLSQWSAAAGSMVLMCKSADLTVERGFRYFYIDEKTRSTQAHERSGFRLTFYNSLPQEMSVVNPMTAIVYKGDWIDGYEHGRGTMIWPDGSRYEGKWIEGKPVGRGTKVWPDGDRYEGDWQDGKRHGKGTMIWSAGAHYEGGWRDGKQHGTGTMRYPNGVSYQGDWVRGSETGHGIFITTEGERHEGDFIDVNGSTGKGAYITKSSLGILYWEARSKAASNQPDDKGAQRKEPDPLTTSVIDAEQLVELCDDLENQDYEQVQKLLQR